MAHAKRPRVALRRTLFHDLNPGFLKLLEKLFGSREKIASEPDHADARCSPSQKLKHVRPPPLSLRTSSSSMTHFSESEVAAVGRPLRDQST
jgi:hypothetical protein